MKIKIRVDYIYSQIVGTYPRKEFKNLLSFHPDGYRFSPKYQNNVWDGRIHLLEASNIFPTGLIPRVQKYCKKAGIKIVFEVLYKKTTPKKASKSVGDFNLRPYQFSAVKKFLKSKRGIIKGGTGAGKTLMSMAVTKSIGGSTIFLVHTKDLLYQTYEAYSSCFDDVGIIGDGKCIYGDITICSIPTISRNPAKFDEWLSTHKLLIGDEVHHAASKTWFELMSYIPAEFRLGLTATPGIGDNKMQLEAVTGPVVSSITARSLIDQGYLTPPKVKFVEYVDEDSMEIDPATSFQTAFSKGVTKNVERNEIIAMLAADKVEYPCLIMVKTTTHMKILKTHLDDRELNYVTCSGADSSDVRKQAITDFASGDVDILLVTTLFDEGVDIPAAASLILAGGGSSAKKVVQRVGRVLRIYEGKSNSYVYDFIDTQHKHLLKHSETRKKVLEGEGYDVELIHVDDI